VPTLRHNIVADASIMDLGVTFVLTAFLSKALSAQLSVKVPNAFAFDSLTSQSMLNSPSSLMGNVRGNETSQ
jgi:hypothetical protein